MLKKHLHKYPTNVYPVLMKSRSVLLLCIAQTGVSVHPGL